MEWVEGRVGINGKVQICQYYRIVVIWEAHLNLESSRAKNWIPEVETRGRSPPPGYATPQHHQPRQKNSIHTHKNNTLLFPQTYTILYPCDCPLIQPPSSFFLSWPFSFTCSLVPQSHRPSLSFRFRLSSATAFAPLLLPSFSIFPYRFVNLESIITSCIHSLKFQ